MKRVLHVNGKKSDPLIESTPRPPWSLSAIFSGMIPRAEGSALINVMREEDSTEGILVPMNCHEKSSGLGEKNQLCHPATKDDRDLLKNLALVSKKRRDDAAARWGEEQISGGVILRKASLAHSTNH